MPGRSGRIFLAFLFGAAWFLPSLTFSYRDNGYNFVPSGAMSTALGGNLTAGIPSLDGLYGNPALLTRYTNSIFSYEFDAELRFKGFRTDYRLTFDSIPAFGFLQKDWFGVSFFSVLRGGVAQDLGGAFNFSARKLGIIKSFVLGPALTLGFNVGPVFAFERNGSSKASDPLSTAVAVFPSLQAGLIWKPLPMLTLGTYLLTPNYFDYNAISQVAIQEWTPLYLGIGGSIEIVRGFRILTEWSYQGWDWITYLRNGVLEPIDIGGGPFDFFQNLFFTLGLHYQSDGGRRSKERFQAETLATYRQLSEEIRILSLTAKVEAVLAERKALQEESRANQDRMREIRFYTLTPAEEDALRADEDRLARKKTEYRFTTNSLKNPRKPLRGEERTELELRAENLLKELPVLELSIQERREKKLTPEDEKTLADLSKRQREILREMESLKIKEIRVREEDEKEGRAVEAKARRGGTLNAEEEQVLSRLSRLAERQQEIRKIQARANWVGFAPPRGEYFLSFKPEVEYQPGGGYFISASLNAGFSFRPFNIENLTFYVSFTDKSLFRLIGLFPDNDLVEVVKVTAELRL